MKLSQIINYPLGLLGLKLTRKTGPVQPLPPDMAGDAGFMEIYNKIKDYSIVDPEGSFALYHSVKYILDRDIQGDFAECGVWKGGCCMLIAYTLMQSGVTNRKIWLYDTFSGMTKPGLYDGDREKIEWEEKKISDHEADWCLATLDEVQTNMKRTGYPKEQLEFVKGRVEDTIPGRIPQNIALLRLDTDWYESTKHELQHLYPRLTKDGVLIIDDYGAWQGARKAADEYLGNSVLLNRINWTGRLVIK